MSAVPSFISSVVCQLSLRDALSTMQIQKFDDSQMFQTVVLIRANAYQQVAIKTKQSKNVFLAFEGVSGYVNVVKKIHTV